MYAHFDPTTSPVPNTNITKIDATQVSENTPSIKKDDEQADDIVKGVHSIKVLRDSKMNTDMLEPEPNL